ncbi:hypothetical protein ACR820_01340 [Streptomyces netropsis]
MHVNTLLVQQVLAEPAWSKKLSNEDRRGLTALSWSNVNLYGTFRLDTDKRLDLGHGAPPPAHRRTPRRPCGPGWVPSSRSRPASRLPLVVPITVARCRVTVMDTTLSAARRPPRQGHEKAAHADWHTAGRRTCPAAARARAELGTAVVAPEYIAFRGPPGPQRVGVAPVTTVTMEPEGLRIGGVTRTCGLAGTMDLLAISVIPARPAHPRTPRPPRHHDLRRGRPAGRPCQQTCPACAGTQDDDRPAGGVPGRRTAHPHLTAGAPSPGSPAFCRTAKSVWAASTASGVMVLGGREAVRGMRAGAASVGERVTLQHGPHGRRARRPSDRRRGQRVAQGRRAQHPMGEDDSYEWIR